MGAVYGEGPEWQTCRPAGFLSKKFSVAQQHSRTHEHETIAMLEALMKWERTSY
jgi:RNase H-like domain found in reverse transcriptase